MTLKNKQSGFSFIEALIVIVVIGGIALVGTYVMNNQNETEPTETSISTSQPAAEEAEIETSNDLKELEDSLNATDMDELDTTDLDEAEAELL